MENNKHNKIYSWKIKGNNENNKNLGWKIEGE